MTYRPSTEVHGQARRQRQVDLQVVITLAGTGSRMRAVSASLAKGLLPLSGAMRLGFYDCALTRTVETARDLDATRIIAVTNDDPFLRSALATLHVDSVSAPPEGEAAAVSAALSRGAESPFTLVWSGDNLVGTADAEALVRSAFESTAADLTLGVAPERDMARFSRVTTAPGGSRVTDIEEKPIDGEPGLAKSGLVFARTSALRRCLSRSHRDRFDEWSMTSAILSGMRMGLRVEARVLTGGFQDIGTPQSYATALEQEMVHNASS